MKKEMIRRKSYNVVSRESLLLLLLSSSFLVRHLNLCLTKLAVAVVFQNGIKYKIVTGKILFSVEAAVHAHFFFFIICTRFLFTSFK